jgi:hypothetical protein
MTPDEIQAARLVIANIPGSGHPGSIFAILTKALNEIERLRELWRDEPSPEAAEELAAAVRDRDVSIVTLRNDLFETRARAAGDRDVAVAQLHTIDALRDKITELRTECGQLAAISMGLRDQIVELEARHVVTIRDQRAEIARLDALVDAQLRTIDALREAAIGNREKYEKEVRAAYAEQYDARLIEIAALKKEKEEWDEHYQAMRACIVYADRRGDSFDFDEWNKMVEFALRAGRLPPSTAEDAQAKEAMAWAAVTEIRKDRDLWKQRATVAEAVRDDARAASQRALDEKRAADAECDRLRAQLEKTTHNSALATAWKNGVLEANDKLYAAYCSNVELTWSKISELLNILLNNSAPPLFRVGETTVTAEQLINDSTYETFVPTADDEHIIGEPLAQRLALTNTDPTFVGAVKWSETDPGADGGAYKDPATAAQQFYEENRRHVTLKLTLEEVTTVANGIRRLREQGLALSVCSSILRKIEEACK